MEREEIVSNIENELGSTQLVLSEQTRNALYDDLATELKDTDAANVPEGFWTRKANLFKTMSGQIHADTAHEVSVYKEDFEKRNKQKPEPHVDNKLADQLKSMQEELNTLKSERAASAKAAKREDIIGKIKSAVTAKFKDAGIKVNDYIMTQTMRDVEIDVEKEIDINEQAKSVEAAYNKNLKAAGVDVTTGVHGTGGQKQGKAYLDDYFSRKAKKEGWGK
jgi:hypothetical protein